MPPAPIFFSMRKCPTVVPITSAIYLSRALGALRSASNWIRPLRRNRLDVLVEEDRVAVRIEDEEAARPGRALVRLGDERDTLCLELALRLAHVGERPRRPPVLVPARVEREHVLLEQALE